MARSSHRKYDNDFPSVTQLIGQLLSPGLVHWWKTHTMAEINAISSRGKQIGTDTHEAIHQFIETGKAEVKTEYAPEVTNALKSFMLFRQDRPDLVLVNGEISLTSAMHQFNGQVDCFAKREGLDWLADWKSQEIKEKEKPVIYDEAKIQCSAYWFLSEEMLSKKFEKAIIVALAKDKIAYSTYELGKEEADGWFNEVFLPLLKIWKYRKALSKKGE